MTVYQTFKVNRNSLEKALKHLFRRAEGWQPIGSGECQLYGRTDENGVVRELFVHDFAGHQSWLEGDDIVRIATQEWYSWQDYEDLTEWLHNELLNNDVVFNRFKQYLEVNEMVYKPYRHAMITWFEDFDSDTYERWLDEWREIWLDEHVREFVSGTIEMLENHPYDKWVISEDIEEAELELD